MIEALVSKLESTLASLPDELRERLASSDAGARAHAHFALRRSQEAARLVELLVGSALLREPDLLRPFVDTSTRLDAQSVAGWLVERAAAVGSPAAVGELAAYSTAESFAAREVIVLDGVRVRRNVPITNDVEVRPIASLQSTTFRDQFGDAGRWRPDSRAALVRSFAHRITFIRDGEPRPADLEAISEDERLPDIARLFTLLKGAAPVAVAHWWEHDPTIPFRQPTTGAYVTAGFEARFHPSLFDDGAAKLVQDWLALARACPEPLWAVLRVVLDRLNAAKRRRALVDRSIELGIAAEALFIRDEGPGELRFKLATRAAWVLGSSREERAQLFRLFRAVYDARSQAVHTGRTPSVKRFDIGRLLDDGSGHGAYLRG